MNMVITEQVPKCEASGGTMSTVNNLINSMKTTGKKRIELKNEIKTLIQEAFEAGFDHAKGD